MKIERLLAMLNFMMHKQKVTAPQLAALFEVSERTIYRDIETLERSGVPIIAYPGRDGGYAIMEQYALTVQTFTDSEKDILLRGLSLQDSIFDQVEFRLLAEKIENLKLDTELDETFEFGQISMQPQKLQIETQLTIHSISKAIAKREILSFDYTSLYGEDSQRNVYPQKLIFTYGSWYFSAYCLEKKAMRQFKLTRMTNLKSIDEKIPASFSFPAQKEIPTTPESNKYEAKLFFPKKQLGILYDYIPKDWIKMMNDEEVQVTLNATNKESLIYHPILYFEGCTIQEPSWLADSFRSLIEKRIETL